MKINLLPQEVYNKIAAGEVVDRPYSVVKELVENAIDAGATEISVEIEEGGKKLVRVSDNGCGIAYEDLKYAFSPHATSKLRVAEDLYRVQTLGFRGEAVASIAAVSRMKILSKTADGQAYSLSSEGGALGEIQQDAGANGTVVTVENLFFNTPARLKFLKSDGQEEGDVTAMMSRFLLSSPHVSFTYTANGRVKYRSFGDGLKSALAVAYGSGVLENCYELDADKHGIRIHGFIGNQNFSKPNRSYQSLFVNGRYVVNQTVSMAIANAYASYLMKRQYPFYVLFLEIPPEIVDVNVHPNKADVRFADNQIIYGCVYSVISAVLDGNSRALEYLAEAPKAAPVESHSAVAAEKLAMGTAWKDELPQTPQMSYAQAKKELAFDLTPVNKGAEPRFFEPQDATVFQVHAPTEDVFTENQRILRENEQKKAVQEKIDPQNLQYKGELFRTYLIYEIGDNAYFIDQHAAHERLIFNRLQARLERREPISQPMLVPYILNMNAQEFAFLEKSLTLLRELGFEAEEFGGTSVKISAVPVDLQSIDLQRFFGDVLASMESLRAIKLADLLRDKLASAACKAAVKGGELLTEQEVRALIEEAEGDMGLRCPHGRPVAVKMKKQEIEKLFKRIV